MKSDRKNWVDTVEVLLSGEFVRDNLLLLLQQAAVVTERMTYEESAALAKLLASQKMSPYLAKNDVAVIDSMVNLWIKLMEDSYPLEIGEEGLKNREKGLSKLEADAKSSSGIYPLLADTIAMSGVGKTSFLAADSARSALAQSFQDAMYEKAGKFYAQKDTERFAARQLLERLVVEFWQNDCLVNRLANLAQQNPHCLSKALENANGLINAVPEQFFTLFLVPVIDGKKLSAESLMWLLEQVSCCRALSFVPKPDIIKSVLMLSLVESFAQSHDAAKKHANSSDSNDDMFRANSDNFKLRQQNLQNWISNIDSSCRDLTQIYTTDIVSQFRLQSVLLAMLQIDDPHIIRFLLEQNRHHPGMPLFKFMHSIQTNNVSLPNVAWCFELSGEPFYIETYSKNLKPTDLLVFHAGLGARSDMRNAFLDTEEKSGSVNVDFMVYYKNALTILFADYYMQSLYTYSRMWSEHSATLKKVVSLVNQLNPDQYKTLCGDWRFVVFLLMQYAESNEGEERLSHYFSKQLAFQIVDLIEGVQHTDQNSWIHFIFRLFYAHRSHAPKELADITPAQYIDYSLQDPLLRYVVTILDNSSMKQLFDYLPEQQLERIFRSSGIDVSSVKRHLGGQQRLSCEMRAVQVVLEDCRSEVQRLMRLTSTELAPWSNSSDVKASLAVFEAGAAERKMLFDFLSNHKLFVPNAGPDLTRFYLSYCMCLYVVESSNPLLMAKRETLERAFFFRFLLNNFDQLEKKSAPSREFFLTKCQFFGELYTPSGYGVWCGKFFGDERVRQAITLFPPSVQNKLSPEEGRAATQPLVELAKASLS